jgi:hypothetical protein
MPECARFELHRFNRLGICTKRGCHSARTVLHAIDALMDPDESTAVLDRLDNQLVDPDPTWVPEEEEQRARLRMPKGEE